MTATLLLAASLVLTQPAPAESDLAAQVRQHVRQLDSDELAARDAAEKALVGLGPAILDLLPVVHPRMSAEMRVRLGRIEGALQTAAIEAATQATRITLKGESLPLAAVLEALQKQSGNKLIDFRPRFGQQPRDMPLTVDLNQVPFWQALDQVLDQAELGIYQYTGEPHSLGIVARPPDAAPRGERAAYSGVFRFEATSIEATRDLRNPRGHSLSLMLEVAWEPRLAPILIEQPLADLEVNDDQGRPIAIDGQDVTREVPVEADISAIDLSLPLIPPDRSARKIASLKGKLLALMPGRVEKFPFDQLADAKSVEQRKGGVSVILETFRRNGDIYEARILVQFDKAANALESHRGWIYKNDAYLLSADGKRVDNAGLETTRQGLNEIGLSYKFVLEQGQGPQGHTFVYETPAALVKKAIPYQLNDIPLP